MKSALVLAMVLSVGSLAHADKAINDPACVPLVKQCEGAPDGGFQPGAHKTNKKGLWVDCVRARAKGKDIPGVTISPADAQKCLDVANAHRGAHKPQ